MLHKRIAVSLIALAGSIVVPVHQSVKSLERQGNRAQWADGSPMPIPKPTLVADGSPMPIPKPNEVLVADGSPMPIPKPTSAVAA